MRHISFTASLFAASQEPILGFFVGCGRQLARSFVVYILSANHQGWCDGVGEPRNSLAHNLPKQQDQEEYPSALWWLSGFLWFFYIDIIVIFSNLAWAQ